MTRSGPAPTTRAVTLVVHDFEPGWDAYTERPRHLLPVGTICHGPQVPAALGLLRGRTTAAFPPLLEADGESRADGPGLAERGGRLAAG